MNPAARQGPPGRRDPAAREDPRARQAPGAPEPPAARRVPWAPDRVLDAWALLGATPEGRADPADARACAAWARKRGSSLAARWEGADLEQALREHGVAVLRPAGERASQAGPVRIAALYSHDDRRPGGELRLYADQLKAKRDALLRAGVGEWPRPLDVERLHLAHEFFHFLEHVGLADVAGCAPQVRVGGLLGCRPRRLPGVSEVAAHAFARALAAAPAHPVLLDCVARAYMAADPDASMEGTARRAAQTLVWLGG